MPNTQHTVANRLLWTAQVLAALVFLFAGSAKFFLPPAQLQGPIPLPLGFIYFIGVCEVAGALGLILPGVTGIRPSLTPLAALGLLIIMIGATVITATGMGVIPALFPLVVGIIVATIAWGRWRAVPLRARRRRSLASRTVA
ncbi:MAG TPA: DoxX family protein [Gemmatimonadaceae bacterium]|nr:DoxX family protein [Gemmatimonadaceae bacterium]